MLNGGGRHDPELMRMGFERYGYSATNKCYLGSPSLLKGSDQGRNVVGITSNHYDR